MHGVDLILGGHDHLYYVARGATSWEGYELTHPVLGAEHDAGDVLVVKSGTDFRDLSEFTLTLVDTPPGSVRRKIIKEIHGVYTYIKGGSGADGSRSTPLDAAERKEKRSYREATRVHPIVCLRSAQGTRLQD